MNMRNNNDRIVVELVSPKKPKRSRLYEDKLAGIHLPVGDAIDFIIWLNEQEDSWFHRGAEAKSLHQQGGFTN